MPQALFTDDDEIAEVREFRVTDFSHHIHHRISPPHEEDEVKSFVPSSSSPPSPLTLLSPPYRSSLDLPVIHHIRSDSIRRRQLKQAESALSSLQSLPTKLGLQFDCSEDQPFFGLPITYVEPESCVKECGIMCGDVLIELNGVRIINVQDLQLSLDGLIAGDIVPIIVARRGEELLFQLTIEARHADMKHVRTLHALLDEVAAIKDNNENKDKNVKNASNNAELIDPSSLSLSEFLDIPQYRYVLLTYMRSVMCEESVLFLLCERAFQRIPPAESARLFAMAYLMYDLFIDEKSLSVLNIDASHRKTIQSLLFNNENNIIINNNNNNNENINNLLYHSIAQHIYSLCESDVFKRFLSSEIFHSCNDWQSSQSLTLSIGQNHRQNNNFEPIPHEEFRIELIDFIQSFINNNSSLITNHRIGLKKYKNSFYGKDFYNYLLKTETKVKAREICQRCVDGFVLIQCNPNTSNNSDDGTDFQLDVLYTACSTLTNNSLTTITYNISNNDGKIPSSSSSMVSNTKPWPTSPSHPHLSHLTSGYVFLQGINVVRVWLSINSQTKKLFLSHDHTSANNTSDDINDELLFEVSLKNSKCLFHHSPRHHCAYLHLTFKSTSKPRRSLNLRIESFQEAKAWTEILKYCGTEIIENNNNNNNKQRKSHSF